MLANGGHDGHLVVPELRETDRTFVDGNVEEFNFHLDAPVARLPPPRELNTPNEAYVAVAVGVDGRGR